MCSKYVISSIVNDPQDQRLYAKVYFLDFVERGLLDTGANVSCLGSDLARHDFSSYKEFQEFKSFVKTADGKHQKVHGYLDVDIMFRNRTQKLRILIVPSISQRLVLGLDFWRSFNLAPDIFDSIVMQGPSDKLPP